MTVKKSAFRERCLDGACATIACYSLTLADI
jgi:hypothetical protein